MACCSVLIFGVENEAMTTGRYSTGKSWNATKAQNHSLVEVSAKTIKPVKIPVRIAARLHK